jgi:flagellar biosynthesis chaperone FliJ
MMEVKKSKDSEYTEKYLSQIFRYEKSIEVKLEKLARYRDSKTIISDYITPGSGGSTGSAVETCVLQIEKLEKKIVDEINELTKLKADIERKVKKLEKDELREVIEYRYICGMKWSEVAESMAYTKEHIYRLHRKALQEFDIYA